MNLSIFNRRELRSAGFTIIPLGHKVCFQDQRNGYISPSYDADTCMEKLAEYIGLHRSAKSSAALPV